MKILFKRGLIYISPLLFCGLVFVEQTQAQLINPAVSQLFYNRYLANPAMAGFGKQGGYQAFVSYAGQMQPIQGSPSYKIATFDYGSNGSTGLGFSVNQEEAGILVNTRVMATYSYAIRFDADNSKQLRMGISLGTTRSRIDMNKVNGSLSDVVISGYNGRKSFIDADFGASYINKGFTVEASLYNLRRRYDKSVSQVDYGANANYSTYYLAVGNQFTFKDGLKIDSRLALRGIHNYKDIVDVGVNLSYKDEPISFLAVYHSNKSGSFGLSFGDKPNRQCYFLYTTATNDLRLYNRGSFEAGFRFKWGK